MSPGLLIVLVPALLILLGLSALISAAETSMTAASRGRLHQLERDGDRAAARVNRLLSDQENMIGAILLSNNVLNIGASAATTAVFSVAFPGITGVLLSTVLMTVLIVVFCEILPKTLAIAKADDVARALSRPTTWVVRIFGPLAGGAQFIVRRTLAVFGIRLGEGVDVLAAHEEIRGAVEYHHSEGAVENEDRRMLGGVLDLVDVKVEDVMIHRRSMDMLDADLPFRELVAQALASPHTRLPLYQGDQDNIIGVVNAKDLARAMATSSDIDAIDITQVAREPWFVPETTNLKDQLSAFLQRRVHFALVVDEYGDVQGLLTLEDIIEEIVGEIEDEHDVAVQGVHRQGDGSAVVDGDVTIRDLNRATDWQLPDDEWVSVAGLVLHNAQTIPDPGQVFIFYNHRFTVLRRQRNQITSLRVSPPLEAGAVA